MSFKIIQCRKEDSFEFEVQDLMLTHQPLTYIGQEKGLKVFENPFGQVHIDTPDEFIIGTKYDFRRTPAPSSNQ